MNDCTALEYYAVMLALIIEIATVKREIRMVVYIHKWNSLIPRQDLHASHAMYYSKHGSYGLRIRLGTVKMLKFFGDLLYCYVCKFIVLLLIIRGPNAVSSDSFNLSSIVYTIYLAK